MPVATSGISVGRPDRQSGTLGCVVRRRSDGMVCLLTAGHVLTAAGATRNDVVLSPGASDGGRDPEARIASLDRSTLIGVAPAGCKADVAIASLIAPHAFDMMIPGIGLPAAAAGPVPNVGHRVQLFGKTSGYQQGIVVRTNHEVCYEVETDTGVREICFRDLVLCTRFSSGGDSGAVVLDMQQQIVGIHMGGSDSSSFFCKIGNVCSLLDVDIMGVT